MAVVTLLLLGAVLSISPIRSAKARLDDGRAALLQAEQLLRSGNVAGADRAFVQAKDAFEDADSGSGHLLLSAASMLPLLGRTPDSVRTLAEIGELIAQAGRDATAGIKALPDGLSSLAPRDRRFPLGVMAQVVEGLDAALLRLNEATALAAGLPDSFVLGSVARARDLVRDRLSQAAHVVQDTDSLLHILPSLLGGEGTRTYLVAAQNPAELRGTGGFIGSYATLTATQGRLSMGRFHSADDLPNLPVSQVQAPSRGFAQMYNRFGGAGFWPNINMTPDAPTAGALMESLYEKVRGVHLDGTIFIDPQALADLLRVTGPVEIPSLGARVRASTAVRFLTNTAYFREPNRELRKAVLGIVAHDIWEHFLETRSPVLAIEQLVHAADGGHILWHVADPEVQATLQRLGLAGELGPQTGDFLGVFLQNASGTKIDYYTRQTVRYDVSLAQDGSAGGVATVELANGAPALTPRSEVFGPVPHTGLGVGDNLTYVATYCGFVCQLEEATKDGEPLALESHIEKGFPLYGNYVRTDKGDRHVLSYLLTQPSAWEPDGPAGTYRLRVQGQPTIRPTAATVSITSPPGTRIVATNVPMDIEGRTATWRGTLAGASDLEIRFEFTVFDGT